MQRNKSGSRANVLCPRAVAEYNKIMGSENKCDE